uniref:Arrestin C-terminal-like domain-containing protein n=1 Tax=Pectinophora gossypiella TaxID=13191 RepID=A0A1E1WP20_PECGO
MSLSCQMKIFIPPEGFFKPLQRVEGIIKYTIYEEIALKKIIISLKGNGCLSLKGKAKRMFRENYVHLDQIVQEDLRGFALPAGTYEDQFSFVLPKNIPSSILTLQTTTRHEVDCCIQYYIRIKFFRGYWKADKTFKKNIIVKAPLNPRLPMEPVTYRLVKQLGSVISAFSTAVKISATIENSVIRSGDSIKIVYTVENRSYTKLTRIYMKLIEVYSFKPNRPLIKSKNYFDVDNTITIYGFIDSGVTVTNSLTINVPQDKSSLENSALVTRQYYIKIIGELPLPHPNVVLKIPVQIGTDILSNEETQSIEVVNEARSTDQTSNTYYPPPPYWMAMGEIPPGEEDNESPAGEDSEIPGGEEDNEMSSGEDDSDISLSETDNDIVTVVEVNESPAVVENNESSAGVEDAG